MEKELLDMMDEEIDEEKIDELNTSSTSTAYVNIIIIKSF